MRLGVGFRAWGELVFAVSRRTGIQVYEYNYCMAFIDERNRSYLFSSSRLHLESSAADILGHTLSCKGSALYCISSTLPNLLLDKRMNLLNHQMTMEGTFQSPTLPVALLRPREKNMTLPSSAL
jgi:hypothetical protein